MYIFYLEIFVVIPIFQNQQFFLNLFRLPYIDKQKGVQIIKKL